MDRREIAEGELLLDHPILQAIWDECEKEALEELLKIPSDQDRQRLDAAEKIKTIRFVRSRLRSRVLAAKQAMSKGHSLA